MNEPMPWRLQIAVAAMQGDWSVERDPSNDTPVGFETATRVYFKMADAMLAEHARTAQVSQPTPEDKVRVASLITDLRKEGSEIARADCYGWGNLMNRAADELERMLNESNK